MHAKRFILGFCLMAGMTLSACSGSATPQLISSFPRYGTPTPFATSAMPPARIFNTSLDIDVPDVDAAAQQAARLAAGNGGYLVTSQSWVQDQRHYTALTLAVPASRFDALRGSLIELGRLVDEHLSSQPAPWPSYAPPPESIIVVTFSAMPPLLEPPALPNLGWSPAQTFAQAFRVFASIFTILINVVIWLSVVVGPFVLMGLGLRWLIRRLRRPA